MIIGWMLSNIDSTSYFHYYIRDHQGNNRVVANYQGTIEQTTHYYPYGGILSQSTNQGIQKYKYSGKEFDRMHGLDMYDFGARQQDPETGMFTSMDPLCEKYYNVTPYSYCVGNPVRYVDPEGRKPRIYTETQGLGHTFVTIGEGKNTIVYTYGRYGALGSSGIVLHSFTPTGEGILLKKSGAKAMKYLADEAKKDGFSIFEIENVTDADVASYFDNLWNKGDQSTVDKDPDARVIDEYNLLQNNCTTKTIQGINGYKETEIIPSETKVTHYTVEGYPHSGTERIFTPSSLKQKLKEISTQHPKEIIYVTNPKQFIQNLQQVRK